MSLLIDCFRRSCLRRLLSYYSKGVYRLIFSGEKSIGCLWTRYLEGSVHTSVIINQVESFHNPKNVLIVETMY